MWLSIWLCALPWDQSCVWAANSRWPEFWCTGCICTFPSVRHEMGTFHTPPHCSGRSRAPCTSLGTFPGPYEMLQLVYSTWEAVIIWGASLETWAFLILGEWKLTEEGRGRHLPPLSHLWLSSFSVPQLGYNITDVAEPVKHLLNSERYQGAQAVV